MPDTPGAPTRVPAASPAPLRPTPGGQRHLAAGSVTSLRCGAGMSRSDDVSAMSHRGSEGFHDGVLPDAIRSGRRCLVSLCVRRAVRCPYYRKQKAWLYVC